MLKVIRKGMHAWYILISPPSGAESRLSKPGSARPSLQVERRAAGGQDGLRPGHEEPGAHLRGPEVGRGGPGHGAERVERILSEFC